MGKDRSHITTRRVQRRTYLWYGVLANRAGSKRRIVVTLWADLQMLSLAATCYISPACKKKIIMSKKYFTCGFVSNRHPNKMSCELR